MADGSRLYVSGEVADGEVELAPAGPRRATAAFWIGVAGLVTWLVPTLGLPLSGIGLVLAVRGQRAGAERSGLALVLSAIGVGLSLTMWVGSAVVVETLAR
jgi:hypothetical protein